MTTSVDGDDRDRSSGHDLDRCSADADLVRLRPVRTCHDTAHVACFRVECRYCRAPGSAHAPIGGLRVAIATFLREHVCERSD